MSLQNLKNKYGDDIKIFAANCNENFDYKTLNGEVWRGAYNLTYNLSNYMDMGKIRRYFTQFSTPMLTYVGKDMEIYFTKFGYTNESVMEEELLNVINSFSTITAIRELSLISCEDFVEIDLASYFRSIDNSPLQFSIENTPSNYNYSLSQDILTINKSIGGYDSIAVKVENQLDSEIYTLKILGSRSASPTTFSDGVLGDEWESYGDEVWGIDRELYFVDGYSAISGVIESTTNPDSTTSTTLSTEQYMESDGIFSFVYSISSELFEDSLLFTINGVPQDLSGRSSGEQSWHYEEFEVEEGDNSFEWRYSKSIYYETGDDRVLLDLIEFNPNSSIEEERIGSYSLVNLYPNPFNNSTTISFCSDIGEYSGVIYNSRGEVIEEFSGNYSSGSSYIFDGSRYSSGVYYLDLKSDDLHVVKRIVYLR